MNAFYFLNYFIYSWYKKRDKDPLLFSFVTPVLLMYFNTFSIIFWMSILLDFKPPFTKTYYYMFLGCLALLSYLVLYRSSRYK
ncbi:MAG: hypothetical protein ABI402_14825 [Ferruginibacter sp.]